MAFVDDIVGKKFGKLTIQSPASNRLKVTYVCDCGSTGEVFASNLKKLERVENYSCGCFRSSRLRHDLTGLKLHNVTPYYETGEVKSGGRVMWLCRCDCGSLFESASSDLKRGHTKSCGCHHLSIVKQNVGENNPAYIDGRTKTLKQDYSQYRLGAGYRNLQFSLTYQEFQELVMNNCDYCGDPPEDRRNGIDRVDSSVGYIKENCVACCYFCNLAKSDWTKEQFITKIEKIYKHLKR